MNSLSYLSIFSYLVLFLSAQPVLASSELATQSILKTIVAQDSSHASDATFVNKLLLDLPEGVCPNPESDPQLDLCSPQNISLTESARKVYCENIAKWQCRAPFSFYEKAFNVPFSPEPSILEEISEIYKKMSVAPPTIVIIPELFSEFVTQKAFGDVLTDTSPVKESFSKLTKDPKFCQIRENFNSDYCDPVFNILELGELANKDGIKGVSLNDLVEFGSIRTGTVSNEIISNVVLLKSIPLSMDTVRSMGDSATIYARRIQKLANLMPNLFGNVVLVGYGRGAPVGFEILSQSVENRLKYPWVKNVRSMLSIGGMIFGSAIIDESQLISDGHRVEQNSHKGATDFGITGVLGKEVDRSEKKSSELLNPIYSSARLTSAMAEYTRNLNLLSESLKQEKSTQRDKAFIHASMVLYSFSFVNELLSIQKTYMEAVNKNALAEKALVEQEKAPSISTEAKRPNSDPILSAEALEPKKSSVNLDGGSSLLFQFLDPAIKTKKFDAQNAKSVLMDPDFQNKFFHFLLDLFANGQDSKLKERFYKIINPMLNLKLTELHKSQQARMNVLKGYLSTNDVRENLDKLMPDIFGLSNLVSVNTLGACLDKFRSKLVESVERKNPSIILLEIENEVLRMKHLFSGVLSSTKDLSTNERIKWWTEHAIPKDVNYFSIVGLMDKGDSSLIKAKIGFDYSPDTLIMLRNYADYSQVGTRYKRFVSSFYRGGFLNDGQVSIEKATLWPDLVAGLNPMNEGINSELLAIIGTHHWGLAMPFVIPKMNKNKLGPVPRANLLKGTIMSIFSKGVTRDTKEVAK